MANLSIHRMENYDWVEDYKSKMGKEAFDKYIHEVYVFLLDMKPGTFFQIEGNVKNENTDLFIKVCSMFMHERHCATREFDTEYIFSNDYTKIICREIQKMDSN